VTFLDDLLIEPGAIYIMDHGYFCQRSPETA
jgi:hypothetical protein